MRLFSVLYQKMLGWAAHRHARWYLAGLSFAESSFFPLPPDVMLAPMVLARPHKAWYLAGLTTLTSVAGGILGYVLGVWFIHVIEPLIFELGYQHGYEAVREWFGQFGLWAVFLAGFSPIPYKLFTISAGAMSLAFLPFVLVSMVGRGARFFLVAGLLYWAGPRVEPVLEKYIERIGWGLVLVVMIILALVYY